MEDNRRFDKFDNLIQVGDTVFFCAPNSRRYASLEKGKVIGFTPKMVIVEYVDGFMQRVETTKLYCDRLAVAVA